MLGVTAGVVWLVLPVTTSGGTAPVALGGSGTAVTAAADPSPGEAEDAAPDAGLALPAAALLATTALAGYGCVRRVRRSRTRTTPGGAAAEPRPAAPVTRPCPPRPSPPAAGPLGEYVRRAAELLPAALADAEAELSAAAGTLSAVRAGLDSAAAADPLGALRRVVRACAPLGPGRTGALSAAARLAAREAVADAEAFLAAHRDAVGRAARTHLAQARRLLASPAPAELVGADALARRARALAEQDVLRAAL